MTDQFVKSQQLGSNSDIEYYAKSVVLRTDFVKVKLGSSEDFGAKHKIAKQLIKASKCDQFFNNLWLSAINENKLIFDKIEGIEKFKCWSSRLILGQYNFLIFDGDGEFFCVIQRIRCVEMVWFPSEGVLYSEFSDGMHKLAVEKFIVRIMKERDRVGPLVPGSLQGALVSFHRPYHYFYQVLSGLELMSRLTLFERLPNFVSLSSGHFSSPARLYKVDIEEIVFDIEDELNDFLVERNGFLLSCVCGSDSPFYRDVEHRVVSDAENFKLISDDLINLKNHALSGGKVLWLGLMAERRVWREQVEALSKIINCQFVMDPSTIFVIDGWTSPEAKSSTISVYEQVYLEVMQSLLNSVPKDTRTLSLIGRPPREKIFAGLCSNFFLADMATSSMFISRFCKKHGVVHANPSMNYQGHEHFNVTTIPLEYVVEDDVENKLKAGYSIASDVVVNIFFEEMGAI